MTKGTKAVQWVVVVIFILIVAYFVYSAVANFLNVPKTVDLKTLNEARRIAIDLKVQSNAEWANITFLLLGFIWVVLLAEKADFTKLRIQNPPEILFFITTNVCYVFSLIANFIWKNRLVAAYWDIPINCRKPIEVPDILCKHLSALSNEQFIFLILGIVSTGLLLLFSRFAPRQL
ncbi:MAG TPA: hypothetical protein VMW89_15860 [Desulfatiglandales bacterium]|nr:hypothetical protein [Desulfatiglandales bacterium]